MESWLKTVTLFLVVMFAILVACTIIAVVVYDLIALRNNWRTISDDTFRLGHIYVAFLVGTTGTLSLAIGMLLGHLFLGQAIHGPKHPQNRCPVCFPEGK